MNNYTVDLKDVFNADELHRVIGEAVPLPEYYGGNLDALYDVLSEITEETTITFINTEGAEAAMPKYIKSLRRMSKDVQNENPNIHLEFL